MSKVTELHAVPHSSSFSGIWSSSCSHNKTDEQSSHRNNNARQCPFWQSPTLLWWQTFAPSVKETTNVKSCVQCKKLAHTVCKS